MYLLKRKPDLDDLGSKMGLCSKKYKKRYELISAIQKNHRYTRYIHCYNDSDPISLASLHTIEDEFYFEWSQHGFTFGADIRSIQNMFARRMYITPFSLDMTHWKPDCDFDMRLVDELRIRLGKIESESEHETNIDGLGWTNWVMFKLDALCGNDSGYIYGKVNDLLIKQTNPQKVKGLLEKSMLTVYRQVLLSDEPTTEWITDCYYQMVVNPFMKNKKKLTSEKVLKFVIDLCETFESMIGEKAHQIIFMIFNDA
jgi:hypothetical protein